MAKVTVKYDEETEEYIGDMEVLSGKIANLTKTAKTPGGISLFTDETKQTYKSTYDLLKEISEIYDDLTDRQQAGLLEVLAGKRQGNTIAAILGNFEAAENSMQTMSASVGSAMNEMGVISESLEYKLNQLKQTGVGIFQNIFKTDELGGIISAFTSILELIDGITGALGGLGTVIATVSIVRFIRNFARLKRSHIFPRDVGLLWENVYHNGDSYNSIRRKF